MKSLILLITIGILTLPSRVYCQDISYHEELLESHYNLLKQANDLKRIFGYAPFAFLFAPGPQYKIMTTDQAKNVYNFDWVGYANACANLKKIELEVLWRDAAGNCTQTTGSSARFWCNLANVYEKAMK